MSQLSSPICNPPFLPQSNYPSVGGDISSRICADLTQGFSNVTCCLPCPASGWVYSDSFPSRARASNYVAIPMLVMNLFLLLSFLVLPKEQSHRHYLSTGLTVSLVIIAIAFIIPLGTKPDLCHNDITPNNLNTDVSCGFTGSFVELAAMGVVVWILLRSIWMALRIIFRIKQTNIFRTVSLGLGIGLPLLFLAISLPITGVSYRLGTVCVPNSPSALKTWFAWVLLFAAISWIIQAVTILYCIWRFASSSIAGDGRDTTAAASQTSTIRSDTITTEGTDEKGDDSRTPFPVAGTEPVAEADLPKARREVTAGRKRRIAWRQVRRILVLQWRTIVLSFIIVNLVVFFGMAFIAQTGATMAAKSPRGPPPKVLTFAACLMANKGDKEPCLHESTGLGLSESHAVATLVMAPCLGILVFLLLARGSMFIGWWSLIRNSHQIFRRGSSASDQSFVGGAPKREDHGYKPDDTEADGVDDDDEDGDDFDEAHVPQQKV